MSSLHAVVRQDFLEMIRPEILMKVLMASPTYCQRYGLVDTSPPDPGHELWQACLSDLLNVTGSDVPASLIRALTEIQDLSFEEAVDPLMADIRTITKQTWPPFWPQSLSHAEIVALAYLDYYEQFRQHYMLLKPRPVSRFVEYISDKASLSNFQFADEYRRQTMSEVLGQFFQKRQRSAFCRVRVSKSRTETRWIISHGQTEHHQSIVANDKDYQHLVFRPIQHDTIILCSVTGRLLVNARYPCEIEQYRSLIGEIYFDCPEQFNGRSVYSVSPLRELGADSLSCAGVPHLSKVHLRQIEMYVNALGRIQILKDQNLADCLSNDEVRKALDTEKLFCIKLACFVADQTHPLLVHIKPPNEARLEPRPGYEVVTQFLISRGFLVLKPAVRQGWLFKSGAIGG